MSRYEISSPEGSAPGCQIAVGWDRQLSTFFAMSYNLGEDELDDNDESFWIGATPCEIPTAENLVSALAEHTVTLPDELLFQLRRDQQDQGRGFASTPAALLLADMAVPHVPLDQARRIAAELTHGDTR